MATPTIELSDGAGLRSPADIKAYLVAELAKSLCVDSTSIDTAAPLETLGVDSLMALGMAGALAAYLDRDVPATLMWDYRSIDALAEGLATAKPPPPLPNGVVLLNAYGTTPPIFGFPGLAGTPMAFVHVASKLDSGNPFYGVAAPGFEGVPGAFATVEEIAAAMLRMIRQVRPHGPYLLAGYCFGGLLAFEAARQLLAAGEAVSMLAIYDAFTPAGRTPRPPWQRLFVHLSLLAAGKRRPQLQDRMKRLGGWSTKAKAEYWIEPAPAGEDSGAAFWKRNSGAASRYMPRPYPGAVLWLQAAERAIHNRFYKMMPCGGWSDFANGGVTTVTLPGNHGDIIGPEHAQSAADALRPHLIVA